MREDEIRVFVDGVINFYTTIDSRPVKVGTPYLIQSLPESISEFTGMIGIAGRYSGNIIFTAPKSMLLHLLIRYGETRTDSSLLLDLVGEIANTISGNAREKFGADFELTPPIVSRGRIADIKTAPGLQTYCIPIVWEKRTANLIVAIA